MTGLTNEQVQQRIEEGKVNANENPNTRSYKQIVRENVLTFFNFLNLALMVMVLLVGSYKNSMFMGMYLSFQGSQGRTSMRSPSVRSVRKKSG